MRILRVNELLRQEISQQLHTYYQKEAVCITITKVDVSPDLRTACIYYSVIGDAFKTREAGKFLINNRKDLRYRVGKRVVLKYLPRFEFRLDNSIKNSMSLLQKMDEMDEAVDQEPEN